MQRRMQIKRTLKRGLAVGLIPALLLGAGCTPKNIKRTKIQYNPEQTIRIKPEQKPEAEKNKPKPEQNKEGTSLGVRPDALMDFLGITRLGERKYFIGRFNKLFKERGKNGAVSVDEFEKIIKTIMGEIEYERYRQRQKLIPQPNPLA